MSTSAQSDSSIYATWSPPMYDTTCRPRQLHSVGLEQPRSSQNSTADPSVFARMAKWCPDGSVALSQCEDRTFRYLNFPPELLGVSPDATALPSLPQRLTQSSPILDYAWYPSASSREPASFCFVASVRECPVKLLDASDGRLRASYPIVDHRERQVAPHSLAFNLGASRLYCGLEDAIEVFDVHRPGEGTRLRTTPSKKSRDGLKGIISALAFAPDASSDLYAAGSLSPSAPSSSNLALFSEATGDAPLMFLGAEGQDRGNAARVGAHYGIRAGVSQISFNPARPFLLYVSFRRVDAIYSWDLRGDVSRAVETFVPAQHVGGPTSDSRDMDTGANAPPDRGTGGPRRASTNQRLRFDVDYGGNWLATGNQTGGISIFDLAAAHPQTEPDPNVGANAPLAAFPDTASSRRTPILEYDGHHDAVGSVAFHPFKPVLLSVSGSRHYDNPRSSENESASDESSSSSDDDEEEEGGPEVIRPDAAGRKRSPRVIVRRRSGLRPMALDTSVKLWSFEHGKEDYE